MYIAYEATLRYSVEDRQEPIKIAQQAYKRQFHKYNNMHIFFEKILASSLVCIPKLQRIYTVQTSANAETNLHSKEQ